MTTKVLLHANLGPCTVTVIRFPRRPPWAFALERLCGMLLIDVGRIEVLVTPRWGRMGRG